VLSAGDNANDQRAAGGDRAKGKRPVRCSGGEEEGRWSSDDCVNDERGDGGG